MGLPVHRFNYRIRDVQSLKMKEGRLCGPSSLDQDSVVLHGYLAGSLAWKQHHVTRVCQHVVKHLNQVAWSLPRSSSLVDEGSSPVCLVLDFLLHLLHSSPCTHQPSSSSSSHKPKHLSRAPTNPPPPPFSLEYRKE